MKYTMKKTFALLLTLMMLVNIFPASVFAEQGKEVLGTEAVDPVNLPKSRSGSTSVTVSIAAENVDLSADGSEYYLAVGRNDETVPYQFVKLNKPNPAGSYEFTVDGISDEDPLFVILKRYDADETPNPGANDNHDILNNMNTSNTVSVGEDDYNFTWEDQGDNKYIISIEKEGNNQGGGSNPDEPTDGHKAIITLGKGVEIGPNTYVVFFEKAAGKKGGTAVELNPAYSGDTQQHYSGTEFIEPWDGTGTYTFESGDDIDVWVVFNAAQGIQDYHIANHGAQISYSPVIKSENASTYTFEGKPVIVTKDLTNNTTIIQIGETPNFDVAIQFKEDGTSVTPVLTDKYYVLTGTEEGQFEFYAPISADGTVGNFAGEGLTESGKLPLVNSIAIVEYTGNGTPTLMELMGSEEIEDGGELGDYILTYPDTLEPTDSNTITFTANSIKKYSSTIKYVEEDGTTLDNTPSLEGNYYILALKDGTPQYYAPVPAENTAVDFRNKDGKIRKIPDGLTFEIRKVSGDNPTLNQVAGGETPTTLGKYQLSGTYNTGNGTCTFTAVKSAEKPVTVNYLKKDGNPDNDPVLTGNYYMVASKEGKALYYAKVNTSDNNTFTNGVDELNGLPKGMDIKLVEYRGTKENPTLDDLKDLHAVQKLGKYTWQPQPYNEQNGYVFNAIESGKVLIRVSTYEHDNVTPTTLEEPIPGKYYIRVPLLSGSDGIEPWGYAFKEFEFRPNTEYTEIEIDKFISLTSSPFGHDAVEIPLEGNHIDTRPGQIRVVKLLEDHRKPANFEEACSSEYVSDQAPEGWAFQQGEPIDGGYNIHLTRNEQPTRYHVRLKFDTTNLDEINLDGGAYVKVTVEHETGDDTYAYVSLSNDEYKKAEYITVDEDNGYTYIDIPITEWKNKNGGPLPQHEQSFTGNEKKVTTEIAYGSNQKPTEAKKVNVGDYYNAFQVVSYSSVEYQGAQNGRTVVLSENYNDIYDVIELKKNTDKFTGYTLEQILNGYNIVAICPNKVASPSNSGASAFGDGDFLMEQHQMGGVLVRGDIIHVTGTGVGDSSQINKPSVVGGYIPVTGDPFFNNRQNNSNGWNTYVGSVNTVVSDYHVNESNVQGRGETGTNTGNTIVNDDFVDWDRLQETIINTSSALGAAGTNAYTQPENQSNVYNVNAGSNVTINYPENTNVTINIIVLNPDGTPRQFPQVTGQVYENGRWKTVTTYDYSGIPATIVNNLGKGTYTSPKVQINGVDLQTVEDGSGMSLLWNYPNAQRVNVTNEVTPEFGHIVAPKAYVDVQGGNNSGCMVGNKVRSAGEGHLYPYTGATLLGFYGDMNFQKTVNGGKPTARQKYRFILEKLSPQLTNAEYNSRLAKITEENGEQKVFWEIQQTIQSEAVQGSTSDAIKFADINFDKPGKYYFRVYEKPEEIANTTLDAHQYLIECTIIQYTENASTSRLKMDSIKYYEIDTEKELLHITSSNNAKHASINLAAIGPAKTLTWMKTEGEDPYQYTNTGIAFDNQVYSGLVLTKTVKADKGELAEMTITFTVKKGDTVIKTVNMAYPSDFTNGSKTITLTQADGILPGETYTVTETATSAQQVGYKRTTTVTVGETSTPFTGTENPSGTVAINEDTNLGSIEFGNAYTQDTTSISVEKVWKNSAGDVLAWPSTVAKVTITLVADGTATDKTLELTASKPSGSFDDLPISKADGSAIAYTVTESGVPDGYGVAITEKTDGGYTVTNTEGTTSVPVKKVWNNSDDKEIPWPENAEVTVALVIDDVASDTTCVLDNNQKEYTFENLPITNPTTGKPYAYSVTEKSVNNVPAGFTVAVAGTAATGFTITNTEDCTEVPVKKIWKNSDLEDLPWPEDAEVEVALVIDGTPSTEKTVKLDADQQEFLFEQLPITNADTGEAYEYSVTELSVSGVPDGYTMVVSGDAENGFTITNTEDCTEVPVKKIWKNSDLEDLPWPEDAEVEVALVIDGTPSTEKTVKLDADQQEFLFEQLPITNADTGEAYMYSVTETSVSGVPEGYTMVVTGDAENGFTITNTEDCTEVLVEKVWKSATGETLPWPGDDVKVTVTLVADDVATDKTVELSKDKMSDSFTDLPISKTDGSAIVYTVTESDVSGLPKGYTVAVTGSAEEGYTVTNTEIADVTAALKKVWKDDENRDGLRPTGLKVELLADGEGTGTFVMLNEENNWTAMLTGLLRFRNGKEIAYSWKEPTVVGYTLTGTVTNGSLTTLTNTHEADKTVVEVEKVWVDSGKHPDDVEVQLFADGKALGDAVKLNAGNGWKYSWTKLCRNVREAGVVREIKYTVAETKIPEGYVAKITGNASTGFVITNTKDTGKLIIEKEFDIQVPEEEPDEEEMLTEIEVVKIWDDNDNKDGNRPKSITVHLLAGGEEVKTAELTAANGWKRTFGDLPKFVNGHPIHYSVTEDPVPLYVSEIHGFTIRNKYQPEMTSVSVRKVWNDENNKHLNRPVSVHMTLSNGMSVILSEENGWMATITGLPTIVNGQPAEYTWTEQEVVGYELESMETEGTVTVFTNKPWHRPDKPTQGKTPRLPGEEIYIEEYETPLGVEVIINHVGDCFD